MTPYVPKPLTSNAKAEGRFGKQDFTYVAEQDVYRCPAGALKPQCTPSFERRVTRWEHGATIEAMQRRMREGFRRPRPIPPT